MNNSHFAKNISWYRKYILASQNIQAKYNFDVAGSKIDITTHR